MGEAINLVENFKVDKVIFNCGEFNYLEKQLIEVLDKKKIPYYSCIKQLNIENNKLYFLNNKDYGNENDNSSVIYTDLHNYRFLFMGDAGVEVEEDLIEKYNLQDIDVLKVGKEIRNTIRRLGGTMPENLPTPDKSLKECTLLKQAMKQKKKYIKE